jgi:hypothetical protein
LAERAREVTRYYVYVVVIAGTLGAAVARDSARGDLLWMESELEKRLRETMQRVENSASDSGSPRRARRKMIGLSDTDLPYTEKRTAMHDRP